MKYDNEFKITKNICLYKKTDEDNNVYECSNCKEEWQLIEGNLEDNNIHYCPVCGYKISNDIEDTSKYCKECKNQEQCYKNHWCRTYDTMKIHKGSFVCDNFLNT